MPELIRIENQELVRSMLYKDELYKGIYPDLSNTSHIDFKNTAWFQVLVNNEIVGILILKDFSSKCLVFHGGVYKKYRGTESTEWLKDCLKQIKNQVNCTFITTVSEHNKAALNFNKRLGYQLKATIPNGCKDGSLLIFGEA